MPENDPRRENGPADRSGTADRSGAAGVGGAAGAPGQETNLLDSPQFAVAASNPQRMERAIALSFMVALAGFAGFGAAYWQNYNTFWQGVGLGFGFAGMGAGMIAWGKYLMPRGPFTEPRHPLGPSEEEREVFLADFASRGKVAVERRGFLLKILGAAGAVFGIVAVFPLLRSLGPLPKKLFYKTAWRKGSYLTKPDGSPVHVNDLVKGGVLTVFPRDDLGGPLSQTILVRLQSSGSIVTAPGRETWGPDGYVAFSKVCTHAGCPVALFEEATSQLLCPCHQSVFDIGQGEPAIPVFGPAPRPLPQLPLVVDSRGYLRAQRGYDEPVGPGFWERDNG